MRSRPGAESSATFITSSEKCPDRAAYGRQKSRAWPLQTAPQEPNASRRLPARGGELEVDDDLAVYVPAGLKLDRRADLLDREACRDGHTELARRDQAGDLLDGAGGGVSAVRRRDPVGLCSDGGDAPVRHAKVPCRLHRLRPVQVDRRG